MTAPTLQPAHLPTAGMTTAAEKKHNELVRQAQKWVAQSFYGTLLKQMRDDPFHSDLFDGGRGGQMFYSLYDQQLADRMSRGAPNKLVNSIVRKIEGRKASAQYLKQSKTAPSVPLSSQLSADLLNNARSYVTSPR